MGGTAAHETYVLIANTSAYAGVARVTLLFEDGSTADRDYPLPANSRTNVWVAAEFPGAAGRRFGTVVESLGEEPGADRRRARDVQQRGRRTVGRGLQRAGDEAALNTDSSVSQKGYLRQAIADRPQAERDTRVEVEGPVPCAPGPPLSALTD